MNVWRAWNKFLVEQVQSEYTMMKMMNQPAKVAGINPDIMVQMVNPKRNTVLSVAREITLSMDVG